MTMLACVCQPVTTRLPAKTDKLPAGRPARLFLTDADREVRTFLLRPGPSVADRVRTGRWSSVSSSSSDTENSETTGSELLSPDSPDPDDASATGEVVTTPPKPCGLFDENTVRLRSRVVDHPARRTKEKKFTVQLLSCCCVNIGWLVEISFP